jgi:formylglycine-generating enzyme required for sulfatase activity
VRVRDEDELFANLPVGAAHLRAKLADAGELDVAMSIVGEYDLDRSEVARAELQGECETATHVVTSLVTGAFELYAGASDGSSAGVGVGSAEVSAGSRGSRETLSRDGDERACVRATTHDTAPPEGCAALLRVELVPIGRGRRPEPSCPEGSTWNGTQCEHPIASVPPGARTPPGPTPPGSTPPDRHGPACLKIPGGNFMLGSPDGGNAAPQHMITVAPFEIDETEVTVAAYRACVTSGACTPPHSGFPCNWGADGREQHPINCVTYDQAKNYCATQSKRLPTEEEWEFAAIGQNGWKFPWGNSEPKSEPCWQGDPDAAFADRPKGTCAVGSHPRDRSPFGVLDLEGNVREWTTSTYCLYPKRNNDCSNTSNRILRGGPWNDARVYPVWTRQPWTPETWDGVIGFRCAK